MDIKIKEIELLEEHFKKSRSEIKKLDKSSASLFLLALIVYGTFDPTSPIKLSIIGLTINSSYAVYSLYLISLISLNSYCIYSIKENILTNRYRELLVEVYGSIPETVTLLGVSNYELKKMVFKGSWKIVDYILTISLLIPFTVTYVWFAYELTTFNLSDKPITIASFLIIILGTSSLILFSKSMTMNRKPKQTKEAGK